MVFLCEYYTAQHPFEYNCFDDPDAVSNLISSCKYDYIWIVVFDMTYHEFITEAMHEMESDPDYTSYRDNLFKYAVHNLESHRVCMITHDDWERFLAYPELFVKEDEYA